MQTPHRYHQITRSGLLLCGLITSLCAILPIGRGEAQSTPEAPVPAQGRGNISELSHNGQPVEESRAVWETLAVTRNALQAYQLALHFDEGRDAEAHSLARKAGGAGQKVIALVDKARPLLVAAAQAFENYRRSHDKGEVARGNALIGQAKPLVEQALQEYKALEAGRLRRPPQNLDPTNGPLTGYVSNDEDAIEEDPNLLAATLQQIDRGLGSIPGLPDVLQFGARFTEQQKRELEDKFDLRKPHAGLKWIVAALESEPQAIGTFLKAGRESAAAMKAAEAAAEAAQAAKASLANASKTGIQDLEKAVEDAIADSKPSVPISNSTTTPQVTTAQINRLKKDLDVDPEKRLATILKKDKYANSPPRAANGPIKRAVYWMHVAEQRGEAPAKIIDEILKKNNITGYEADLTKRVMLDNLTSAKKWGLLKDNANLLKMRAGKSPYSDILKDRIDAIHTIPKSPAESVVNKIWNIRLGPQGPNEAAKNALNATRIRHATDAHNAGFLPDDEFEALTKLWPELNGVPVRTTPSVLVPIPAR